MKKILFFISLVFFYLFLTATQSFASSNFTTNYDVTYAISDNAVTNTKINVTLTNTSDIYYASSYKIKVGFTDIQNIKAFDAGGAIVPKITKDTDGQTIQLDFNQRVVGIGNKLSFTLSFDTNEIAQKIGKIWEINIPGIENQADFSTFNVRLVVPKDFGNPAYIKPNLPGSRSIEGNIFNFSKDDLGSSGISLAFGNEQIYRFSLKYHLYNNNLFPIQTEIALPPSTNYQDVAIENIIPKPVNVVMDKDGNWLAEYKLLPSQKITVLVNGKARIILTPKTENLSNSDLSNYLKNQPYWQVSDSQIKALANQLKTPSEIYNYVVNKLFYDYARVAQDKPRLGAKAALNNPNSAVCLEFTDLFIALSRAAGIPAREVDGFAYTQNSKERPLSLVKDILHAWPEYYDMEKKSWIMVDPTWGKTTGGIDYFNTLDFDHFAFVIKGENSSYPVPAGGYKTKFDENSKDIEVNFANKFDNINPVIQLDQNIPGQVISGLPIKSGLIIKNTGAVIAPETQIAVGTRFLSPSYQKITTEGIPPYGSIVVPVYFEKTPFLTNRTDIIKISVAGNTFYYSIRISPFFLNGLFILGGGIIVAFLILSKIAARFWNIPFFR